MVLKKVNMSKRIEEESKRLSRITGMDFSTFLTPGNRQKISRSIQIHRKVTLIMISSFAFFFSFITLISIILYSKQVGSLSIIVFFITGAFFCAIAGTGWGTIRLSRQAIDQSRELIVVVLDLMKEVRTEIATSIKENPDLGITDFIKGLSYGVIIPAAGQIIDEKLKFFAKPAKIVIENSLFYFTRTTASFADHFFNLPATKNHVDSSIATHEEFTEKLNLIKDKLQPLGDSISQKVAIPGKILMGIALVLGVPIMSILYL